MRNDLEIAYFISFFKIYITILTFYHLNTDILNHLNCSHFSLYFYLLLEKNREKNKDSLVNKEFPI